MTFYPKAIDAAFEGDLDVLVDTIKAYLLDADYTYSNAHDFLDDIPAGARLAVATITGPTSVFSGDTWTFDCNDITWTSVTTGNTATQVVFYKDTGVEGTSVLISHNNLVSSVPTNGGNITGQIHATGIAIFDVTP